MPSPSLQELESMVADCLRTSPSTDGWVNLSVLGLALRQRLPGFSATAFGASKLRQLVASFASFEVKVEQQTAYARCQPVPAPPTATGPSPTPLPRLDYSPRTWAQVHESPAALRALASLALDEPWSFGTDPDPSDPHPILSSYLKWTFLRLQHEGKLREFDSLAAFNTGLVDQRYEPIHAVFKPNGQTAGQRWQWSSFCIAGEGPDGKNLVRCCQPLPPPARYFSRVDELIYDVSVGKPVVDWEHILIENIGRLPVGFLREHVPAGCDFTEPATLPAAERAAYFAKLGAAVRSDARTYRSMKNRLSDALDLAFRRASWSLKTAIPQYNPRQHKLTLLLPLALVTEDTVDLALVVERTDSGAYLGHTVYRLDWAYLGARLVGRPDSAWLVPAGPLT